MTKIVPFLLFCGVLLAQQPQPGPMMPPRDPVAENLFPPEMIMGNQRAINLEEAQRSAIRAEILKSQTRFTELQWQLQDAMEVLVGVLRNNTVDEAKALEQLDKVLASEREIKRTQIALMVRIKNKLTPEQQARLRQMRPPMAPHPPPEPRP